MEGNLKCSGTGYTYYWLEELKLVEWKGACLKEGMCFISAPLALQLYLFPFPWLPFFCCHLLVLFLLHCIGLLLLLRRNGSGKSLPCIQALRNSLIKAE